MVEVGNPAPDIAVHDANGNEVTLDSLLGKGYVLIVFYRGNWCHLCNTQLAHFASDYHFFREVNTDIIAISADDVQSARRTAARTRSLFPILIDADCAVIEIYGIQAKKRELKDIPALAHRKRKYAMPAVIILDSRGIVRYKYVGTSFTDRPRNAVILTAIEAMRSRGNALTV